MLSNFLNSAAALIGVSGSLTVIATIPGGWILILILAVLLAVWAGVRWLLWVIDERTTVVRED